MGEHDHRDDVHEKCFGSVVTEGASEDVYVPEVAKVQ